MLITICGVCVVLSSSAQTQRTVRDFDGNVYPVVIIGNQEWMAENLRTTRFNDGVLIPEVTEDALWGHVNGPGYCWYDNDEQGYKNRYGALYNGYAAQTDKLCPGGWHVPSDDDWTLLTGFLEGETATGGQILLRGELKSVRTAPEAHPRWDPPNTGATDRSGFSALPGGQRGQTGSFHYIGKFGFWWSATDQGSHVLCRGMRCDNAHVFRTNESKNKGLSVRCVRDMK